MQQLVFGVYAEGRTDERYYPTLLLRYLADVCFSNGFDIEILEPVVIARYQGSFIEQMQHIEQNYHGLQLTFVHSDADDRAVDRVLEHKWEPWMQRCQEPEKWIPIIPVRMLESWLLADREALSKTFIISIERIVEITGNVNAEHIADPKEKLRQIARAGRQRKTRGFEALLAERSRFSELERLPSFQVFAQVVQERLHRFS